MMTCIDIYELYFLMLSFTYYSLMIYFIIMSSLFHSLFSFPLVPLDHSFSPFYHFIPISPLLSPIFLFTFILFLFSLFPTFHLFHFFGPFFSLIFSVFFFFPSFFLLLKAPEWIGMIVGHLIRLRVLSLQSVNEMVVVMRKYALGDGGEYDPTEATVAKEYGAFLTAVERASSSNR